MNTKKGCVVCRNAPLCCLSDLAGSACLLTGRGGRCCMGGGESFEFGKQFDDRQTHEPVSNFPLRGKAKGKKYFQKIVDNGKSEWQIMPWSL